MKFEIKMLTEQYHFQLYLLSDKLSSPAITIHYGSRKHRVLLKAGGEVLTHTRLLYEIRAIFSLWSKSKLLLALEPPPTSSFISSTCCLLELANKAVYVITWNIYVRSNLFILIAQFFYQLIYALFGAILAFTQVTLGNLWSSDFSFFRSKNSAAGSISLEISVSNLIHNLSGLMQIFVVFFDSVSLICFWTRVNHFIDNWGSEQASQGWAHKFGGLWYGVLELFPLSLYWSLLILLILVVIVDKLFHHAVSACPVLPGSHSNYAKISPYWFSHFCLSTGFSSSRSSIFDSLRQFLVSLTHLFLQIVWNIFVLPLLYWTWIWRNVVSV